MVNKKSSSSQNLIFEFFQSYRKLYTYLDRQVSELGIECH